MLQVDSVSVSVVVDNTTDMSGEIPRKSFERGMANQLRLTPSGDWEPDPLVLDERFMAAHIRGKVLPFSPDAHTPASSTSAATPAACFRRRRSTRSSEGSISCTPTKI